MSRSCRISKETQNELLIEGLDVENSSQCLYTRTNSMEVFPAPCKRVRDGPRFASSLCMSSDFKKQSHLIDIIVARDGVEPPTSALSGPKLMVITTA